MPETQLLLPVRRRVIALALVAGTGLDLLTASGLVATAPAAAGIAPRIAVDEGGELRADLAATIAVVETGEAAVAAAAQTVADVQSSGFDLGTNTSIDTTDLARSLKTLSAHRVTGAARVILTADAAAASTGIATETAALRGRLDAAIAQKQAEEAAAAEAAAAAANTPDGARTVAAQIAANDYGWSGDQFSCLDSLWMKESGWNYQAYNPSGATGIPQALPGDKMASFGSDWATNATTQIRWGLDYIANVYGSPCSAWGHSQSVNWY